MRLKQTHEHLGGGLSADGSLPVRPSVRPDTAQQSRRRLCKVVDRGTTIAEAKLLEKHRGKAGDWKAPSQALRARRELFERCPRRFGETEYQQARSRMAELLGRVHLADGRSKADRSRQVQQVPPEIVEDQ